MSSARRPQPPEPRASLVDSGWSEPAPPERELPSYADSGREHLITRVDDQIQARIAAMNYDDRTEVTGRPGFSPPPRPLPPPRVPPPPPLPVPHAPVAPAPLTELIAAPTEERTLVDAEPPPTTSRPPSRPASLPPPSLPPPPLPPRPSFAPMQQALGPASFVPPPTLGEALTDKVRVGGAELPLWGVLLPAFGLAMLFSALLAGLLGSSGKERTASAPAPSASEIGPNAAAPSSPLPSEAPPSQASGTGSLIERARSGDERAIGVIEHQRPEDRGSEEALALAAGKVAQAVNAVGKLRARLASDPGLAKDPKIIADLRRMALEPDTSRDALAAMAALPGPLSADLLYEAWTSTADHSSTTELAQGLLMGRDVRPKASPALAVAIDLREAESCEDNAKILQRAIDVGDRRAFAPLTRLLRRNGCGPGKRDDCFACLRDGEQLKKALTAVKLRREPELVRRDTH